MPVYFKNPAVQGYAMRKYNSISYPKKRRNMAATYIQAMIRGRLARNRTRWTAKRAVGKARRAQSRWRRSYFRKYGRAV